MNGVTLGYNTRINLKSRNDKREIRTYKISLHLHFFLFFSFHLLNYVVLSHGNTWSIVMHIHLAEENPLGKLQCTVG